MSAEEPIQFHNWSDEDGNPAGGNAYGVGFAIGWQNGATRAHGDGIPRRNGAFVEEVLEAVMLRIEFYQRSKFACDRNALALGDIQCALRHLRDRTREREERGVEGTHQV